MPQTLYGRSREQEAVRRLVEAAVERGGGGALLLMGEPGIGKTALLEDAAAVAEAAGARVLRATGIESEAELPFSALHLLLGRVFTEVAGRLPEPQRAALDAAFGRGGGSGAPDRLVTGLAVLGVLTELAAAERRPVVCLLDDAQWVDRASADALLIAMRRLEADPVVVLGAAREGEEEPPDGVPLLRLGPLAPVDAAALLDASADGLSPTLRYRVLKEAHGNPLALGELPRAEVGDHGSPALTGRLARAFRARADRLPRGARTLLLLAALEESGELAAVRAAARALGADAEADLRAAVEAELVRVVDEGRRVAFRHPLVREAIRQGADPEERASAHGALASALEADASSAERRAWHRALAARGPDESTAAELEHAAERARARGGLAASAAAAMYERASRLSPTASAASARAILAAEAALSAGDLDRAERLATAAGRGELRQRATAPQTTPPRNHPPTWGRGELRDQPATGPHTTSRPTNGVRGEASGPARLAAVRAGARFARGEFPSAHTLLLEASGSAPPRLAARLLLQDLHVAWYLGEAQLTQTAEAIDAVAPRLPAEEPAGPLLAYVRAVLAGVLARTPSRIAIPPLRETVLEALRLGADNPRDLVQVCGSTLAAGDDESAHEFAAELVEAAQEQGAAGALPTLLFFLAEAELFHGRHRDAAADAAEALRTAQETGQVQWTGQLHGLLAYLAALDGDAERCRDHADAALRTAGGDGPLAPGGSWAQWALGVLDLGAGRAEDAMGRLGELVDGPHRHTVAATRAVPDLVEAAVRAGCAERAHEPLERFERWAGFARREWADALVQRCRALVAADGGGVDELVESCHLASLTVRHRPFERARSTLLYGEWLRRGRRRTDAQRQLRSALEEFERVGAAPWALRVRTELDASGAAAPTAAQAVSGPGALTSQELQVARLAARGLSNREIAARLFLSPRTVGHHLYKAYPKLGIASRTELKEVLD